MPAAINLPLMNDDERAAVGTCYKRRGRTLRLHSAIVWSQAAPVRCALTRREACLSHPTGYLCCARGGQRSHITQARLKARGVDYPLIAGGYKALRQTAIEVTAEQVQNRWC